LELAFAHAFIEDANINRTENSISLLATTQGSADVISVGSSEQFLVWGANVREFCGSRFRKVRY